MIICILGRHGSGKTTVGRCLERHGFTHISLGDLKRLSRKRILPDGISPRLMGILRMQKANTLLSWRAAMMVADLLKTHRLCSVDGFPASPDHLELLPDDTVIVYCATAKILRESRLGTRARETGRRWTPDVISTRDLALADVITEARKRFHVIYLSNGIHPIDQTLQKLICHLNLETI